MIISGIDTAVPLKFDFNDILIIPAEKSVINSRYGNITLPTNLPLITAPMDTVVNISNAHIFKSCGINVAFPRTIKYGEALVKWFASNTVNNDAYVSFGFEDIEHFSKNKFYDIHENARILIDVANGHLQRVIDYSRRIKKYRPDITIMAGNIANPETYRWYSEEGCIDEARVSIGSGNGCLTSKQLSVGYPLASLIFEINQIKKRLMQDSSKQHKIPKIVADGGMKNYSDIILALALGADKVMIGSIFNKSLESCANNYLYGVKINNKLAAYLFDRGFPIKKYFRGMSTKEAQIAMGRINLKTSEGVVRFRNVEYHLDGWVENFEHYLRSAMSYANAKTLNEFIGKVNFCQITKSAHDRFNK